MQFIIAHFVMQELEQAHSYVNINIFKINFIPEKKLTDFFFLNLFYLLE